MMTICGACLSQALVGGMHPLFFEWCLWSEEHQAKRKNYIVGTLYVAYYALSVTAGNIVTLIVFGTSAWKECWNPKWHLFMIPAAAILAFVEV